MSSMKKKAPHRSLFIAREGSRLHYKGVAPHKANSGCPEPCAARRPLKGMPRTTSPAQS
jgi:hypothetical protein